MMDKQIPEYVLWLDVGLHTGWALLTGGEVFTSGQVHGRLEAGDFLYETIKARKKIHVGWEAYITGHTSRVVGDPGPAHEVIGMARWLTHHHGGTVLPAAPASERKIAIQTALKALNWAWKGDHALSASQHLLAWCLRERYLKDRTDAVFANLLKNHAGLKRTFDETTGGVPGT